MIRVAASFLVALTAAAVAHPAPPPNSTDASLSASSKPTSQTPPVPFWFDEITLTQAIQMRNLGAVRYRVAAGDNEVERGHLNTPHLAIAADTGRLPILRYLVEEVGTDDVSKALSPFHVDAVFSQLETVKYLVSKGANVTSKGGWLDETPLSKAVEKRAYSVAKFLIEAGADVNATDIRDAAPLHIAAGQDDLPIVSLLLRSGASADLESGYLGTPLTAAVASCSQLRLVKLLVGAGANVNIYAGENKVTPLHLAVDRGCDIGVVKYLVDSGANITAIYRDRYTPVDLSNEGDVRDYLLTAGNSSVTPTTEATGTPEDPHQVPVEYGYSTMEAAIQAQSLDGVRYRVEAGDSPTSPIHVAAKVGYLPVLKYLVEEAGADIEFQNPDSGMTALMAAASSGHPEVVRYLLDRGANVTARNFENGTALLAAASNILLEPVQYLVEAGADVNAVGKDGKTSLHLAAQGSFIATVSFLLEHGATLNVVDEEGHTPLQLAALPDAFAVELGVFGKFHSQTEYNPFYTIRRLIQKGADANVRYPDGDTLLHNAAVAGSLESVKYLIEARVDLNPKDGDGDTPLHWLAHIMSEYREVHFLGNLKYLVEVGADLTAKNNNGKTPFDIYTGSMEQVKRLLSPGGHKQESH